MCRRVPQRHGMDGVAPDLTEVALEIVVTSASDRGRIDEMLVAWQERCPIYLAIKRPNAVAFSTQVA